MPRKDPIARARYKKAWRAANRKRLRAQTKAWRSMRPGYARRQNLQQKYGMTVAQWEALFKRQGGGCAICGGAGRKLCVDHNHATGAVRGLLCDQCNHGLGNFRDDETRLRLAIAYLVR
jgi:hypothetical protein